jgi:hypothetical protein
MRHQFLFAGQAREVITQHLESPFGGLTASPKIDEQACDHRTIGLNLNSVLAVTDQMTTAHKLLEEPEEYFDVPAIIPP